MAPFPVIFHMYTNTRTFSLCKKRNQTDLLSLSAPATAEKGLVEHWFWWNYGNLKGDPDPDLTPEEIQQAALDRAEKERMIQAELTTHQKTQAERHKVTMVYGLDFGSVWDRYQHVEMPWTEDRPTAMVLQVQPTGYGYVGKYNSNISILANATGGEALPNGVPDDWDCHDLLSSAFQLNEIPDEYSTDLLTPRLFVRVYNSSADCTGNTEPEIAVMLSATTVFDECGEYSPWSCDRPTYKGATFILAGLVGLGLLLFTYNYFKPKSSKTHHEDD